MNRGERSRPAPRDETSGERRPYRPPRIVFRERIEVITAICDPTMFGKADPFACPTASPPMS